MTQFGKGKSGARLALTIQPQFQAPSARRRVIRQQFMSTENLKQLLDLISKLGQGAQSTFLWYLAYDFLITIIICASWITAPLLVTRAIFKGIERLQSFDR
jgi:hypothetical protein